MRYWYWTAQGLIPARSDRPRPDIPEPAREYRVAYGHHGLMRGRGCTDEEFEEAKAEFKRDFERRQNPVPEPEPDWYPPRERTSALGVDRGRYRW